MKKAIPASEWQFHLIPKKELRYAWEYEIEREVERFVRRQSVKDSICDPFDLPWLEFRKDEDLKSAYIDSCGDWKTLPTPMWPHHTAPPPSCLEFLSDTPYKLEQQDAETIIQRLWACSEAEGNDLVLFEIDLSAPAKDIQKQFKEWLSRNRDRKRKPHKTSWEGHLADLVCYRFHRLFNTSVVEYLDASKAFLGDGFAYRKEINNFYRGSKCIHKKIQNYSKRAFEESKQSIDWSSSNYWETENINRTKRMSKCYPRDYLSSLVKSNQPMSNSRIVEK
jgi:hypothetical protein